MSRERLGHKITRSKNKFS